MTTVIIKEDAHKLIDQLPSTATWDDLMYEIYVREAIEKGIEDSKSGRTKDVSEIRTKYGLSEWRFIGRILLRRIWVTYIPILHGILKLEPKSNPFCVTIVVDSRRA